MEDNEIPKGDEAVFSSELAQYHQLLTQGTFADAFASLMRISNASARLMQQHPDSDDVSPYQEITLHCTSQLSDAIISYLQKLLIRIENRDIKGSEGNANEAKGANNTQDSGKQRKISRKGPRKKKISHAQKRLAMAKRSKQASALPQENLDEEARKGNKAILKELERQESEEADLFEMAQLCRLLRSVDLLKESYETEIQELLRGYKLFSDCVKHLFKTRCAKAINDLEAHRSLAKRTTKLGNVEAVDEDPYLVALNDVLGTAEAFLYELSSGSLYIECGIDGKHLVNDIELSTCTYTIQILDATIKDRKTDFWIQRGNEAKETNLKEEQNLKEIKRFSGEDIAVLNNILNDLVEAQKSCYNHFHVLDRLEIAASPDFKQKCLDLTGIYVQLEQLWLTQSSERAEESAEVQDLDGIKFNNIVDNTFYILKVGIARAIHTGNIHAASATANHIWIRLQEPYTQKVKSLLSSSWSQQLDRQRQGRNDLNTANEETPEKQDEFASMLDSDIAGLGNLSIALLGAINTMELSARFTLEFEVMIRTEFEAEFPDKVQTVDMALLGLQEVFELHLRLRNQAITEVVAECITPIQKSAMKVAMRNLTYDLTNALYDSYERNDSFIHDFLSRGVDSNEPMQKCKKHLTASNFALVVCNAAETIVESFLKEILKKNMKFNALGAIRFEKDVQTLLSALVNLVEHIDEDTSWDKTFINHPQDIIRSKFKRLRHMSFLLQQPTSIQKTEIIYPLESVLNESEIDSILACRV